MENNMIKLRNILNNIAPLDKNSITKAKKRLDSLAKPLGSLGKLEDLSIQMAGINGKTINSIHKKRVIIMCSDNGVVSEGVASCPQRLTREQSINFTKGITGVGVIANSYNTDLMVVDVGINDDLKVPNIIDRKIRKSTSNMAKGPAMSYEEALKAILVGIEMVKKSKEEGYDILGVGEMGIGNTTTSSATMVALTGCDVNKAVGKGAGLTDEGFEKKKFIVKHSIIINKPKKDDPIDVVSKVGGFDIAAMAGVFIGSAYYKIPVVIDGFISSVAALIAVRLNPMIKEYLIPSHASKEIGFKIVMDEIGLEPLLTLDMRLGEGSGCPFAFSIVESSCKVLSDMVSFEEAKIDNSYFEDIMEEKNYVV